MQDSMSEKILANLLIHRNLVRKDIVEKAFLQCQSHPGQIGLGQLLVQHQLLKMSDLVNLMADVKRFLHYCQRCGTAMDLSQTKAEHHRLSTMYHQIFCRRASK